MENFRQIIGKEGEDAACRYLSEHGHAVIERNRRESHLEIDIITVAEDGLHFVEVKTRKAPLTADPLENYNRRKQDRIVSAARKYLADPTKKLPSGAFEIFFDALTVVFDGGRTIINYYPQAYIPIFA